jgi:hypothetical protein
VTIRRVLIAAGAACIVFAFVWTGLHPTPGVVTAVPLIIGLSLLRASGYEWGRKK